MQSVGQASSRSTADSGEEKTISVLLASPEGISSAGLGMLVSAEDDLDLVIRADDVEAAVRYAVGHRPDVIILDAMTRTAVESARAILRSLAERSPNTGVVLLTLLDDPIIVRAMLRDGALAYVLRTDSPDQLHSAIRSAAAGERYVSPSLALAIAGIKQAGGATELTERETEVLRLIGLGFTNPEIGQQMHLSVRTVETHRAHLHDKLGAVSRADLVRSAIDRGLVV